MELTTRRFAAYIATGLAVAVVFGLIVWKLSGSAVGAGTNAEDFAGQPVAEAEATTTDAADDEQTHTRSAAATSEETAAADDKEGSDGGANANSAGGRDPLAPPNANLQGRRGTTGAAGPAEETRYYRPTNAAPPVAAQPQQPAAPARPTQSPQSGGQVEDGQTATGTTNGNSLQGTNTRPQTPASEPKQQQLQQQNRPASDEQPLVENGADVTTAEPRHQGERPRPEDPFSASTREAGAPDAPAATQNAGEPTALAR